MSLRVLIYMLTGETLAVNELFQRKTIQFGDDPFRIGFWPRTRLAWRGIAKRDDRGDRGIRRNAQVLAHAVVFVGPDRVRAAADAKTPRRDHDVLRDASRVETHAFDEKHDRDRDRAPVQVPWCHHRVREIVPVLPFLEHDEAPRLRLLGASGSPSRLEDLGEHVLRHGTILVLADFAFRDGGEVGVHLPKYPGGRRRGRRLPHALVTVRGSRTARGSRRPGSLARCER